MDEERRDGGRIVEDWGFDEVEAARDEESQNGDGRGRAPTSRQADDEDGGTGRGLPEEAESLTVLTGQSGSEPAQVAADAPDTQHQSALRRLPRRVATAVVSVSRNKAVMTAVFFAAWSLFLAFPYFGFGSMSYVALHDTAEMNLPRAVWYGSANALTGMGNWAPQGVSGTDRTAAGFAGDLDALLFVMLPGWLAYGLFMWLQRFIAGYFLYRLLREWRDVSPFVAAAVACAYALFTQPHINMGWTGFALYDGLALPGLPALCYLMFRSAKWRARYRYPAVAAAGLALGFTSHFFIAFFCMVAVCVLSVTVLPRGKTSWKLIWVAPLVFAAAWLLAEVPVLWSAAANAGASQRAGHALLTVGAQGSVASSSWLSRFLQSNALALVLTAAALVLAAWRRSWRVAVLAALAGLTVLFIAEKTFFNDYLFAHLGPLSGFRFDRLFVVLPFLALLAGGAGLGLLPVRTGSFRIGSRPSRYRLPLQAMVGAGILLAIVVQAFLVQVRIGGEMTAGASYVSLYGSPQLAKLAQSQRPTQPFRIANVNGPIRGGAPGAWHPGYAWAYGLETADGYSVLYSQRYREFWEHVIVAKIGKSEQMLNHFRAWGNRVYLFISRHKLRWRGGVPAAERWNLALLSLANVQYIVSPIPLQDPSLVEIPSINRAEQLKWARSPFLGRLRVAADGDFPGLPLYVYKNLGALPRAFLTGSARLFPNGAKVLDAMSDASATQLKSTAYLETRDARALGVTEAAHGWRTTAPQAAGTAAITSYSADEVSMQVSAAKRGVLVVTDSYSRFWKAWVDGREAPIAPVDHTFMGIQVTPGEHEVILKYQPPYRWLFWQ